MDIVPPFPLSVVIPEPPIIRSGLKTSLDCTLTRLAGFTEDIEVDWIGPMNGYLDESSYVEIPPPVHMGNLTLVSSVIIPVLNTSLAGWYTCIAKQPTRTMQHPLQHSAEEILPVLSESQQHYNFAVNTDGLVVTMGMITMSMGHRLYITLN